MKPGAPTARKTTAIMAVAAIAVGVMACGAKERTERSSLSAAARATASASSFHLSVSSTDSTLEADYVAPDRIAVTRSTRRGIDRTITIGSETYQSTEPGSDRFVLISGAGTGRAQSYFAVLFALEGATTIRSHSGRIDFELKAGELAREELTGSATVRGGRINEITLRSRSGGDVVRYVFSGFGAHTEVTAPRPGVIDAPPDSVPHCTEDGEIPEGADGCGSF